MKPDLFEQQWYLHGRSKQDRFEIRSSLHCEDAWSLLGNCGSPDVIIAVLDDGCVLRHPSFSSSDSFAGWGYLSEGRIISHRDGATADDMQSGGALHGTACTGLIAAKPGSGLPVGVASSCRLFPLKWDTDGTYSVTAKNLIPTLDFLSDKVDVISNSWGCSHIRSEMPKSVLRRIEALSEGGGRRGKGIVFVWAAGNENRPINFEGIHEIPYTSGWRGHRWVGVKKARKFSNNIAGMRNVLHVGALASSGRRSHYSNYGPGISLCAPSNNEHLYGRIEFDDLPVLAAAQTQLRVACVGGTSCSAALVSGVAALVISSNPDLTAVEVASILKRTARQDLNHERYPRCAKTDYDPHPSWDISPVVPSGFHDNGLLEGKWSHWFGHGCVDAARAVEVAKESWIV